MVQPSETAPGVGASLYAVGGACAVAGGTLYFGPTRQPASDTTAVALATCNMSRTIFVDLFMTIFHLFCRGRHGSMIGVEGVSLLAKYAQPQTIEREIDDRSRIERQ